MTDLELGFGGGDSSFVAIDGMRRCIGIGTVDDLTTSNTRWVCLNPALLREWAEAVEEASQDSSVYVGVTPDRPVIATTSRECNIGILLSPQVKPDSEGGE